MDITKISDEQLYKLFRDTLKLKESATSDLQIINTEIEKRENKAKESAKAEKKNGKE